VQIRKKGKPMNDETVVPGGDVQIQVADALAEDPRTTDAAIDVVVEQGIVTLEGTVRDDEVRNAAREIATDQPGVLEVVDDLVVAPSRPDDELPGAAPLMSTRGKTPLMPEPPR
jgi:osmotically-inducible protein OsmY